MHAIVYLLQINLFTNLSVSLHNCIISSRRVPMSHCELYIPRLYFIPIVLGFSGVCSEFRLLLVRDQTIVYPIYTIAFFSVISGDFSITWAIRWVSLENETTTIKSKLQNYQNLKSYRLFSPIVFKLYD